MRSISRYFSLAALFLLTQPVAAQPEASAQERQAGEAFARNDCAAALRQYTEVATQAGTPAATLALAYRRIGICHYRAGRLEEAQEAYHAGIAAAERSGNQDLLAENIHGKGLALDHLGRYREALELAMRQLAITRPLGKPEPVARSLQLAAQVTENIGRTRESQEYLEEMLALSRANQLKPVEHMALTNLATLRARLGDMDTAAAYFRQAFAMTPPGNYLQLSEDYNNMGIALRSSGRLNEAKEYYEKALEYAAREPRAWRTRQIASFNLGLLHLTRRQFAEAQRNLERSIELTVASKDRDAEARFRAALAEVFLESDRAAEAQPEAQRSLEIARDTASPFQMYNALAVLGKSYEQAGQIEKAADALQEAARIVETLRAAAPGDPAALLGFLRTTVPLYQRLVKFHANRGDPAQALYWTEIAKARLLNDILAQGGVDEQRIMSPSERDQERKLYRLVKESAADRQRSAAATGRLDEFRRSLYTRHPELQLQRADFAPANLAQLAALTPDSRIALLEFFFAEYGLELIVVRNGKVKIFALKHLEEALAPDVKRFREQLAARDVNYRETARSLYNKLLRPAEEALRGTTSWVLSPDGLLWDVPFQALVDATGKHVLENHAVSYTPSFTALWNIRKHTKPGKPALDLLSIGNPLSEGAQLPDAEAEALTIRDLYAGEKVLTLTGVNARSERVLQEAPRAALIHIAAHAEFNNSSPMYSYVSLASSRGTADGHVTASEILRLPLQARLAVLSACETARGTIGRGEGLLGMGWALLGAGVPASVLSHWKVDSQATGELMVAFHRALRRSRMSPSVALQQAAMEVMKQPGRRNPFYWAAFSVFGDGLR